MKENLFIDLAEEFVNQTENNWVDEQWKLVDQLEKRAKSSNTLISWNEFHSAAERLDQELRRLVPEE